MQKKYKNVQSMLRQLGGEGVISKIRRMSLEQRYDFFLTTVLNGELNPIVARFLRKNFFNELNALRLANRKSGLFLKFDGNEKRRRSSINCFIEKYRGLKTKDEKTLKQLENLNNR